MPHSLRLKPILAASVLMLCCLSAYGQSRSSRLPIGSSYAPDGVLEPWRVSDVACSESGLVSRLYVRAGDRVSKGDRIAELDSASVQMQLNVARAQAAATGQREAAAAEVALNQRKVVAFRQARKNNYGSQLELERAEADLKIAQGRLAAEIEHLGVLELQAKRLEQQLRKRQIVAPIDGIVADLHKELGEYVAPNAPEVVRIVDVSKLRASFFLRVAEVSSLRKGDRVPVRLDNGSRVTAEVEYVSPVADGESGLLEVRVLIQNSDWKILGSRCSLLLEAGGTPVSSHSQPRAPVH